MNTYLKDILKNPENFINKSLTVSGWVKTVRDNKNFGFIELNDGSFFKSIQIVFDKEIENFNDIVKMGAGTAIKVKGTFIKSLGNKQDYEIKAKEIIIEGECSKDYPLQKKRHSFEYLRTIAHLRPRTNTFLAVFRVRSIISYAIHKFFNERNFVYVHTPIITSSDAEGAGEMFKVTTLDYKNIIKTGKLDISKDFFGKESNLTVSGQLSAEAYALAFRNVYTFGPTFRAENSNTQRHAAEFWMVEPEIAFADLNSDIKLAEDMLKYIIKYVMDNAKEELEFFNSFIDKFLLERLTNIVNSTFDKITYTEAINILSKSSNKFEFPIKWGLDLQTEHEKYLAEQIFKKPVFVTDYPKDLKSFYMRLNDDEKTVAATDLLTPGIGEIIGGSQREERLDVLQKRMKDLKLKEEDYWWYLELRKYGGVKHAGFGLGFERCVMYLTGISNIRDVIPFPRTVNNLEF